MPEEVKTIVTKREETIPTDVVARTPDSIPADVKVIAMTMFAQALVRAARAYMLGLSTSITVGLAQHGSSLDAFGNHMMISAGAALIPATISFVTNMTELLARVDQSFPHFRA